MRRAIDLRASWAAAALVGACFTDPPASEDETGTTVAGDGTSSSTASSSAASTIETSAAADADAEVGTDTASPTSGGVTTDSETDDTSSTGATIECGCPGDALLCEEFEADLDLWEQFVGNPAPEPSTEQVACGAQALEAVMPTDQSASTITADVAGDATLVEPFALGGFMMIDGACMRDAAVRIVRLWFDDGGEVPPEYLVELVVQNPELQLRLTGTGATDPVLAAMPLFPKNTWVTFRIEFDMSDPIAPQIAASIDDGPELSVPVAPPLVSLANPHTYLVLGPRRETLELSADCVVFYDDVWLAPMP